MWMDAHNHLHDPRLDAKRTEFLQSLSVQNAPVTRCVVNGTCPDDWPAVAALGQAHPTLITASYGLHPWKVGTEPDDWMHTLQHSLEKDPMAGVGEIGLDTWVGSPTLEEQLPAFRQQWKIAVEMNRPLSLHCLKAWEPLFEELKHLPPHPGRVLVHGFSGSRELAERLLRHGFLLSFSGYLLHPKKAAARETFRLLPEEAITVETDAPDMPPPPDLHRFSLGDPALNHPGNLPVIGEQLAALRNQSPAETSASTQANTLSWLTG